MSETKKITLAELNSKIKENEENPFVQKALLIVKSGLKAYEGTEYTEKQVADLVEVRTKAEETAVNTASELDNDELFEYHGSLGEALATVTGVCFPEASTEEEEQEEETSEEETEESEETEEEETEETEESEEEETEEEGEQEEESDEKSDDEEGTEESESEEQEEESDEKTD